MSGNERVPALGMKHGNAPSPDWFAECIVVLFHGSGFEFGTKSGYVVTRQEFYAS